MEWLAPGRYPRLPRGRRPIGRRHVPPRNAGGPTGRAGSRRAGAPRGHAPTPSLAHLAVEDRDARTLVTAEFEPQAARSDARNGHSLPIHRNTKTATDPSAAGRRAPRSSRHCDRMNGIAAPPPFPTRLRTTCPRSRARSSLSRPITGSTTSTKAGAGRSCSFTATPHGRWTPASDRPQKPYRRPSETERHRLRIGLDDHKSATITASDWYEERTNSSNRG